MHLFVDIVFYGIFFVNAILYMVVVYNSNDLDLKLRVEDHDYFEHVTELAKLSDLYINVTACTLLAAVA